MTLQTVWYDNGTVKCVDSADSPAVIHGAEKATADTDVVGEITLDHVVTVKDGVVTDATYSPPPITDAMWYQRIAAERERRLDTSIPVTLSDGDYIVPVTDRAAAQAPEAARRARADTEDKTRPFPTDKGIVERSADDLDAIGDALDTYMTAVWRRAQRLQEKVADGSITESDLQEGWP